MFRHIVLLSFTPEATAEQHQGVLDGLAGLPAVIPELRSYVLGPDAGTSPGNFDLAVVADFATVDDYRVYTTHPTHLKVIEERIKPILAARAAVQHELPR